MIRPLSSRERKLVAVLILMALIALAWFAIVQPVATGFSTRADQRAQLALMYDHNQRTIASIPRLRRQAERQRGAIDRFVIDAKDTEAGRQLLQDRLRRAAESVGGDLRETGDAEGRTGWVSARVSVRLRLEQLIELLRRVQNDPPYLVVDSLSIGADEALVTGLPSVLDVQFTASIPLRDAPAR